MGSPAFKDIEDMVNTLREYKKGHREECLIALRVLLFALVATRNYYKETIKSGRANKDLEEIISLYWKAVYIAFKNFHRLNKYAMNTFNDPKSSLLVSKSWLDDITNHNYKWDFEPTINAIRNVRDYIRK